MTIPGYDVVHTSTTERQATLLVRGSGPVLASSLVGRSGRIGRAGARLPGRRTREGFGVSVDGGGCMIWLAWRQLRLGAVFAGGLRIAIVVVLVATRPEAVQAAGNAITSDVRSLRLVGSVLVGVPAFIGGVWGAPLLTRESRQARNGWCGRRVSLAPAGWRPSSR